MEIDKKIIFVSKNNYLIEIYLDKLIKANINIESLKINNDKKIIEAVTTNRFNLIIADSSVQDLLPNQLLKLLKKENLLIPVIIIVTTFDLLKAMSFLNDGASDVISVDNLDYLPFSIKRIFQFYKCRQELELSSVAFKGSEEKYRLLVENNSEVFYKVAFNDNIFEGKVEYVSPYAKVLTGIEPSQFIEQPNTWISMVHPDDLENLNRVTLDIINTSFSGIRVYRILNDQSKQYLWLEDKITIIYNSRNEGIGYYGVARDITSRKELEFSLKESNKLLNQYFEYSPTVTYVLRIEDEIPKAVRVSPNIKRLFGYEIEEVLSLNWWKNNIYPGDLNKAMSYYFDSLNKTGFASHIYRFYNKNRKILWIKDEARLIRNVNDNNYEIIGTWTDITEIMDAKTELELSKELHSIAQNIARIGHWELNFNNNFLMWSDEVYNIFGMEKSSFNNTYEAFKSCIHPEDREFVDKAYTDSVKNKTTYYIVHRILLNDGTIKYVSERGLTYYDEKDHPIKSVGTVQDITDKKTAEIQLADSEMKFRNLFESSPDALFVVNNQGKIILCNDETVHLFGYSHEELINQFVEILIPSRFSNHINYRNSYFNSIKKRPMGSDLVLYALKKDGTEFPTEISLCSIEFETNSVLVNVRDISTRLESQKNLQKLSQAAEQTEDCILITDINGVIQYLNPAFEKVTQYSRQECVGLKPNILKSDLHNSKFYNGLWMTITSGKTFRAEFINKRKNGEIYHEEKVISPIKDSSGKITHFVSVGRDITQRKKAEAELIAAKEKAEEMNRVKSYFFANMSHELRTPFIGIKGYAEILSDTLTDPEDKELIDGIIDSSNRLTETLNKILSLTKLEFDKLEIELKEVNLKNVIEDSFKLFSKTAEKKNLFYTKNIFSERSYGDEQIIIKSDERLLREILDNLLSNAIKYTEKGSIELRSEIEKREEGEYLLMRVSDTGIGIPKEKQELIWQEFRQVSEGLSRGYEGTGLGLTITKKYVEFLGGKISVESESGKGSTFIVELPLQRTENVEQPTTIKNKFDKSSRLVKSKSQQISKKILYVEDDKHAQNVISMTLSKNYKLEIVSHVEEALEKVKNNKYDALLLDINLGQGIDGAQLMEIIRKMPDYKETPVIAITAFAAESDRDEFLSRGFTHYISKPFPLKDLIKLVSEIFSE